MFQNWYSGISTVLLSLTIVTFSSALAHPQTVDERVIAAIAKSMTVIIQGQNPGSGIIIAKQGNHYTVLTAKHVLATEDDYQIITPEGTVYPIDYNQVTKLPNLDLALTQFTSSEYYPVAVKGNSDTTTEGTGVYISGWPHPGQAITQRIFQMTSGKLSGRGMGVAEEGYELVYTNVTRSGMSGGPIFDETGLLIGIHGRAEGEPIYNPETGDTIAVKSGFNLGIPLNLFLESATEVGVNLPYARFNFFSVQDLKIDNEFFVTSAAIAPDNQTVIAGYGDGIIRVWDLSTGELKQTWDQGSRHYTKKVHITPDGKSLVSLHQRDTELDIIQVWDLETGTIQRNFNGNFITAMSPDGQLIATGNHGEKEINLWEVQTGTLKTAIAFEEDVTDIAFSADGQWIAIANADHGRILNLSTQEPIQTVQYPLDSPAKQTVRCVAMSPDGTTFVTALMPRAMSTYSSTPGRVIVWDIKTREVLKDWTIPKTHIKFNCSLFFDSSGQRLVLAGGSVEDEESVLMWNVQTGNRLFFPEGKTVAAFSPDGQIFVTGSYEKGGSGAGAQFLSIWRSHP
ncbi:trypsin-like peptidase domain-containing protein [Laspinema sp. A4]|uniref:trypsin-like peptidase domain-containing protein n=1 Tax=Laspinema sp. D2d TaxID=2953686 RepID=UPI0021BAE707|nr:trypsin-like peptidase domain-containing protein [Laspinema sp. D2d]MCT7986430.1 trypsin-like peptidase domain-containing protein [Laspinema sp. D2d]